MQAAVVRVFGQHQCRELLVKISRNHVLDSCCPNHAYELLFCQVLLENRERKPNFIYKPEALSSFGRNELFTSSDSAKHSLENSAFASFISNLQLIRMHNCVHVLAHQQSERTSQVLKKGEVLLGICFLSVLQTKCLQISHI